MSPQSERVGDEYLRKLLRRCGFYLYHQANHSQQDEVLLMLADHGPMSQKELQERLSVRPGSASELISKLEDKEQLLRSRDPSDRRRVILTLTEKGKHCVQLFREQPVETLFTALDEKERSCLTAALEKLLDGWGCRRPE